METKSCTSDHVPHFNLSAYEVGIKTYTAEDLSGIFKLSTRTVWKKCRTRQWPHMIVGRNYRFSPDDIHQITEILRPKPVARVNTQKRMPV